MSPSLVLPTAAAAQLIPEMPDVLRADNLYIPARHIGPGDREEGQGRGWGSRTHAHT